MTIHIPDNASCLKCGDESLRQDYLDSGKRMGPQRLFCAAGHAHDFGPRSRAEKLGVSGRPFGPEDLVYWRDPEHDRG